jgi:ribosomal protein S18 acetylase RimI-like enzyme
MPLDTSLLIRPATPEDAPALSALAVETYTEAFGHSFTPEDLAAHLARYLSPEAFLRALKRDIILLAEAEGGLIGCAQFGDGEGGGDQELRRLYVASDFQNRGVGGALMEAALAHPRMRGAPRILLDVWEHNPGAQRFYQRYGFEVVGTRAFEVESGAPTSLDLVMERRSAETARP